MRASLDLALVNGRVPQLGAEREPTTAIGIAGEMIVVVGDDATVREAGDARTEVVDLRGAVMIPGIVDSHIHPFQGALLAGGADLTDARTLEEVRRLVAVEHDGCRPGEWVKGFGLNRDVFDGQGIDGELIAEAAGGGPALLTFDDLHTELATPRALELAGITGPRTFEEHAEIVIGADGRPTGELREIGAIRLVRAAMPTLSAKQRYKLCARQLERFAALGITGAHGMDGTLETLDLLRELEANGDLVTRLVMPYWSQPDTPEEVWSEYAAHRDAAGQRWRTGVAKLFSDGVVESGTSWLFEPDSEGEGLDPLWTDVGKFFRAVNFFASHGFQVATHATGDRAVHETLNAYAEAGSAPGVRHRIEHIETIRSVDLPRFAAQGVVASMQPQHAMSLRSDRSDSWSSRLGDDRCNRAYPVRSLWESGALVTLGSDWPVADYDWREGMAAAQLRRPPREADRLPYDDQTIDAAAALDGYTRRPAIAVGEADRLGVLKPGYLADVTVLGDDPVELAPPDLLDVPVFLTVLGGEIVFRSREGDE